MVSHKWKTDALKALKRRLNTAADQAKIAKIATNPSNTKCRTLRDKLVKKFTPKAGYAGNPALLVEVNAAWQAYTTAGAPGPALPAGAPDSPAPDAAAGPLVAPAFRSPWKHIF